MNIQSGYGLLAYQGAGVAGLQSASSATAKTTAQNSSASSTSTVTTDTVTISDAARALVAKESGATQARTPIQEKLLADAASSDSQVAERMANEMAYTSSTIFYDISGMRGDEPLSKLSSTGRIIDDSFKERFTTEASSIDAQRLALYNAEKAKGTNPVEILSKMIDFTNAQSKDYLEATGWIAR